MWLGGDQSSIMGPTGAKMAAFSDAVECRSAAVCWQKLALMLANERQMGSMQHGSKHSMDGSEAIQNDLEAVDKENMH